MRVPGASWPQPCGRLTTPGRIAQKIDWLSATYRPRCQYATAVSTDNLSSIQSFGLTVNEVNQPPVLGALNNVTVEEGSVVAFTAAATDSDLPAQALTYTLAIEYCSQGLRANAVCPGSVTTPIHSVFKLPEGADRNLLYRIMPPDKKMRGPEQAAAAVAFLASEDAAHINGEHIRVDGGTLS